MKKMKRAERKVKMMSTILLKTPLTPFWCLMTKEEKSRLKLEGPAPCFSALFYLEKPNNPDLQTGASNFTQTEPLYVFYSVFSPCISGLDNSL
jgi:hypothetical protein